MSYSYKPIYKNQTSFFRYVILIEMY